MVFKELYKNYYILADNKQKIIDKWLQNEKVNLIFQKYNVEIKVFEEKFAKKIYEYILGIVEKKYTIGDCPVMGDFFNILKNKNVAPHELYTICTNLRKSIIRLAFSRGIMNEDFFDEISTILDNNLEGVLKRYVTLFETKNKLIDEQQSFLNQYIDAIDKSTIVSKADKKGRITYVNQKFTEISGYSEDELLGKPHNIIRHPDMPKSAFKEMWNVLKDKQIWSGTVKNQNKHGETYYVNTLIFPILDTNNELKEYLSIRQDLTETISLYEELENTQKEVIYKMGEICESRSKETGNHVKRVAKYSKLLGKLYGLNDKEVETLYSASPMHDIGKVGIPDNILNKPAKLTDEEFTSMKTHAEIGYQVLKGSKRDILQAAAIISYEHHEKYNGKGYPRGLKGDEIHIYGRISAIADVFDALGSDRCYKKAWDDEKIFQFFNEERGEHFDPILVDLFLKHKKIFLAIRDMHKD